MITQQLSSAIELIRHPERMDRSTIPLLQEAIQRYPFYQTLHLLLLQNMFRVHDPDFGAQLKKSAVLVADRSVLFDMVEGLNYLIPVSKLQDEEQENDDNDKTLRLIDSFLKDSLAALHDTSVSSAEKQDPMSDYSFYLEQLPDYGEQVNKEGAAEAPKEEKAPLPLCDVALAEDLKVSEGEERKEDLVDDNEFTVVSIKQRLNGAEAADELAPVPDESVGEINNKDCFTETMAGIYIKQHKYEQALEIIKAISADNPKKSVYFADQIRYLELLIRIFKNKNK